MTKASFVASYFVEHGRHPTEQEIFDAGVAEGRRREREQSTDKDGVMYRHLMKLGEKEFGLKKGAK